MGSLNAALAFLGDRGASDRASDAGPGHELVAAEAGHRNMSMLGLESGS